MKITAFFHELKSKFLFYGFGQAFNLIIPIIIAPYIISVCGLDGFGKVGLGYAVTLFYILIVDYAFDIKGTKKISESRNSHEQIQQQLIITLFTKLVLLLLTFVLALLLIYFIPFFKAEKTMYIFSFMLVLAQVFNPIWFLQGLEDFKTSSIINIVSKSIYLLFIFIFIIQNKDYIWVNFLLGLSSFLVNISSLLYIFKRHKITLFVPSFEVIKNIIINDFMFCISQLILSVKQMLPLVLVSFFLGYSFAGQYKVIDQIISLFRTFSQVYLKFFFPKLCYKFTISIIETIQFWKRYTFSISALIGLTTLFLSVFSIEIVQFFNVPSENLNFLDPIVKSALIIPNIMVLGISLELAMFLIHKEKQYIRIILFVTTIQLILLLVLIPIYQLSGVIASIFFAELLFILFYYYTIMEYKKGIVYKNH